jgi:TadE-like protein
MQRPHHRRTHKSANRTGVAVVELAICLPVLVLILIGTIETCVMLQLQHNLAITAYEGARIGIMPGANATSVETQCEMLLDDRNINDYTITLNPPNPSAMNVGDPLTVTVEADCESNSIIAAIFFDGKTVSESVVMLVE